eukprot:Tamp_13553.p1 GENE.Tamp_13553~~Tamp_13553.p1  ORF type:complete len:469 (+),score=52.93 Tamp_13553:25-1431(+)
MPRHAQVLAVAAVVLLLSLQPQSAKAEDYYQVLGLDPECSHDDIRKAYHLLALKFHPDKNKGSDKAEAEKMFMKIAAAYELLADPEKRKAYDALRKAQTQGDRGTGGEAGGEGSRSSGGPPPGGNVQYHVRISLEHIYTGGNADVSLPQTVSCPYCGGTGHHGGGGHSVGGAPGEGSALALGGALAAHAHGPKCPMCHGWGALQKTVAKQFFVPAGAEEGMRAAVDFHSQGHIMIFSLPHPRFRREGRHLHADVALTFKEACNGFNLTLVTLDQRQLKVRESLALAQNKFPVSNGDTLVWEGEGMPVFGAPWQKGDLYLHMTVSAPDDLIEAGAYSRKAAEAAIKGLLRKSERLSRRARRDLDLGLLLSSRQQAKLATALIQHAQRYYLPAFSPHPHTSTTPPPPPSIAPTPTTSPQTSSPATALAPQTHMGGSPSPFASSATTCASSTTSAGGARRCWPGAGSCQGI